MKLKVKADACGQVTNFGSPPLGHLIVYLLHVRKTHCLLSVKTGLIVAFDTMLTILPRQRSLRVGLFGIYKISETIFSYHNVPLDVCQPSPENMKYKTVYSGLENLRSLDEPI